MAWSFALFDLAAGLAVRGFAAVGFAAAGFAAGVGAGLVFAVRSACMKVGRFAAVLGVVRLVGSGLVTREEGC